MSERRAYVCLKCAPPQRTFLLPGQPDRPAPRCAEHGPMVKQTNMKYMKRAKP